MQIFNTYEELISSDAYDANTCTVLAFGHENEYYLQNQESEDSGLIVMYSPLFRKPVIIDRFLNLENMATDFSEHIKSSILSYDKELWNWCNKEGGIYITQSELDPICFISQPIYFGLIQLDKEGKGTLLTKQAINQGGISRWN